ncbi:MAG: hypothetical protein ACXADX_20190, partial [Candidatus Hodarchaeales archaeon]
WVYSGIFVLLLATGAIRDKDTSVNEQPTSKWEYVNIIDDEGFIVGEVPFVRMTSELQPPYFIC